jgi:hypothetical protein
LSVDDRWVHLTLSLEVTRAARVALALRTAAAYVGLNGLAARLGDVAVRLMKFTTR